MRFMEGGGCSCSIHGKFCGVRLARCGVTCRRVACYGGVFMQLSWDVCGWCGLV